MKNYLIFAASLLALASCSSDDILGNGQGGTLGSNETAIRFNSGTGKITRSVLSQGEAATALNENFVVYGYKTTNSKAQTVYNYYNVKWLGTDEKTETNQAGWEYVGQDKNALNKVDGAEQTIKYWDYSASQYDFIAFSFGKAEQGTGDSQVNASEVTIDGKNAPSYTLTGKVEELAKCYIADRITAKPSITAPVSNKLVKYQDAVALNFRSLSSKVRIGLFETIPGYSVKDVVFYSDKDTKLNETNNFPTLYATKAVIPADGQKGTITVSFGSTETTATDFNQAKVSWGIENDNTSSTISFKKLSLFDAEKKETGKQFIGREQTTPSLPVDENNEEVYKTVIPGTEVGALTLKVDYTLESIDGSGEEIKVTGATATIPAQYTKWQPNYAYTYIFKISNKTNGNTGGDNEPAGLYPITFDAVVTETETGKQETITEVVTPSITTYAKDASIQGHKYLVGANIYASVETTDNQVPDLHIKTSDEDTTPTNCWLYTATRTDASNTNAITEAEVANKIDGKNTTLNLSQVSSLSIASQIDASDAVDGNAIQGCFAKFTPKTAGTYVFRYRYQENGQNKNVYKVIEVVNKK